MLLCAAVDAVLSHKVDGGKTDPGTSQATFQSSLDCCVSAVLPM